MTCSKPGLIDSLNLTNQLRPAELVADAVEVRPTLLLAGHIVAIRAPQVAVRAEEFFSGRRIAVMLQGVSCVPGLRFR